jgi:glutathione S-transferase
MPNGQLPVLELANGKKMGQSGAILRFIGMNHGYYPDDVVTA